MANPEHLEALQRGRYIWNQWRKDHPDIKPDLRTAYLREADLSEYDLHDCDLRGAMLLGADLRRADLRRANLNLIDGRFAEFAGAKLEGASFREAKGVAAEVLRAARGPSPLRKFAQRVLPLAAAAGVGVYVYLNYGEALAARFQTQGAGDAAQEESLETAEAATASRPLSSASVEPLKTTPHRRLEEALREVEFPGWRVESVGVGDGVLVVRLSEDDVSQDAYLPTLAAVCGAVLGRADPNQFREIRVLDASGSRGWVYESPASCPSVLRSNPTLMRLAIAAESRPFRSE